MYRFLRNILFVSKQLVSLFFYFFSFLDNISHVSILWINFNKRRFQAYFRQIASEALTRDYRDCCKRYFWGNKHISIIYLRDSIELGSKLRKVWVLITSKTMTSCKRMDDCWKQKTFKTLLFLSEVSSSEEKMIFNHSRLKLANLWTAVASRIMTSGQRVSDHWRRGIFPFKLPFHLPRYDFRFPRYRLLKKRWFLIIHD